MAQDMPEVSGTVQKFVDNSDMTELTPSCANFEACSDMRYHSKTYVLKGEAQRAFEKLISLKPNQIWDGSSRFEMAYDPESGRYIGKNEELPDVKVGQVFFLELDIALGLKIPVAFKVVDLDQEKLSLSFSYLKQNKSNGIQRITFHQKNDEIHIVHETRFRSSSKFRDKNLYGRFHEILLDDFYEGFKKKM
jgi:hypothetical protein